MAADDDPVQRLVRPLLEPGETLVGWVRAWVSPAMRAHALLAARTRDVAVLTDRRLMLYATGFFTRRPRRRVLVDRLDELTVVPVGRQPERRLRLEKAGHRPLLLELGGDERSRAVGRDLTERARRAHPTEPSTRADP